MPTIDQLVPAVVSADDDSLVVSQGGTARRVTRAQLLTGMQPALALNAGLLGRTSLGLGPPERISVGGGLRLADGMLSSPAPYSVAALPATSLSSSNDLVPISQGGQDRAIALSALLATPGVDVSGQTTKAAFGISRRLSDWAGDAIMIEAFGAVGDGVTDDTGAFTRAVSSGEPVRLGGKTYRVDGQLSLSSSTVLVGTPGLTTILRVSQSGGAWINVTAPRFTATGIIFDAGAAASESWGVLIATSCRETLFETCVFANASGQRLGTGLTIQARDGLDGPGSRHTIRSCTFVNNAVHGLWIQAASGALVEGCSAFQNGQYGICLDYNDMAFEQQVRNCIVSSCRTWGNQRGISVGNYNETNLEPPRWGLANPDACDVLVTNNVCFSNRGYGIAAAGDRIQVSSNQIVSSPTALTSSGILLNASRSQVWGNSVFGPGQYGIDAGGCLECEISGNFVGGFSVGINAGGGQSNRVVDNFLHRNTRAITACNVETDGNGGNFGLVCDGLIIERNTMVLPSGDGGGVYLMDGPLGVSVKQNAFIADLGSSPTRALFANTDQLLVQDNSWNGSQNGSASVVYEGGHAIITVPEIWEEASFANTQGTVSSLLGEYQSAVSSQVTFVRIIEGGNGYSRAEVIISGEGSGAQAAAYIRDGAVVGIALISGGSGYGKDSVVVTILGNGHGAIAVASVGLRIPDGKRLRLRCERKLTFKGGDSAPTLENWTGADITVPSGADIVWTGVGGHWRATTFVSVDNVCPQSNGDLSISSLGGEVSLTVASGSAVRTRSDGEDDGFLTCLGRGSPEGVVSAPPGSDYRNLDGGAGQTLWLKITGLSNVGWSAIA